MRIIKQAIVAEPATAVDLLNEALEIDPRGLKTLRACAGWFIDHQCYQDAAEAYAGILHVQADWQAERRYVACLLSAGRADDAIPRLEHMRTNPLGETVEGEVLSELATAYLIKNEPRQALALVNLAPLQKRTLELAVQLCLYLRAVGRYLTGDRRLAIADLERLYAVNPSFPEVMASKSAMESGDFSFAPPKPYPDWYPASSRDGAIASVLTSDEPVSALPPTAVLESDLSEPSNVPVQVVMPDQTQPVDPSHDVARSDGTASDPLMSPDGVWRWDGRRWIANTLPSPG